MSKDKEMVLNIIKYAENIEDGIKKEDNLQELREIRQDIIAKLFEVWIKSCPDEDSKQTATAMAQMYSKISNLWEDRAVDGYITMLIVELLRFPITVE